jgi:membrane-associated protease RseP (regulator of RpoE activity)
MNNLREGGEAVVAARARGSARLGVHVTLFALTAVSTTVAGAIWVGVNPLASPRAFLAGVPFSATLLAILLCHEFGHYLMCRRHGIDASLPYFLPAPPLLMPWGTFGAFIRIRSRFPNRRALFDVGAGGPWAGFVVAFCAMVVGLRLSHVAVEAPEAGMWVFGDSMLTTALARLVLGANSADVIVHPIALAGWFGLLVTSLNLLPVGQLDGGHVLYAATGRSVPLVPGLLVGALLWLGLRGWPGWVVWAAILVFMSMLGHPPTRDNGEPLGRERLVGSALSLLLFVLTFVPDPIRILP